MRVAINVEQLFYRAPGGTGRYTARLAAEIARAGDTVVPFLAWHRREEIAATFRRHGLEGIGASRAVRLPLPRPLLFDAWNTLGAPAPQGLSKAIRSAEIIHATSVAVPPVRRVPLVVTVHDAGFAVFPEAYPRRGRRFHVAGVRRAARSADVVIAPSEAAGDEIAAHSPIRRSQIRVVHHGVDHHLADTVAVTDVLSRRGLDDAPYVFWVGSLDPRKNVGTLVAAMARLVGRDGSDGAPLRLVLAGPAGWKDEHLFSDADLAALGDRLRVLGAVDDDELRCLYAGAACFAFPSLHEGFGLPVLEAMVQGTPVVCADIPALREVAGEAALFVTPTDVEAWAEALGTVTGDPARRQALVSAGTSRAAGFTWDRAAAETRAIYRELLGAPARGRRR
ncbi:MAG: glycosyltransferase family 4 protein [Acidobacteriota bacterium]|nr:glycosyltransferase family 4 protein [Acidobacteriota bacterium]